MCRLNNWTEPEAAADVKATLKRLEFLDLFAWDMDLTALAGRLKLADYPGLVIPFEDRSRLVELTRTARELRRLMRRQTS